MTYLFLLRKRKRILTNTNLFVRVKALILLLTKMSFWISKNVLMFWIPLWKVWIDMNKFSSIFPKGKTQRKCLPHSSHTHHKKHAHTHQHKHAFMYRKVYTCAYCGRKGHFSKILLC